MSNSSAVVLRAGQYDFALVRESITRAKSTAPHGVNLLDETVLTNFLANPAHYFLVTIEGDRRRRESLWNESNKAAMAMYAHAGLRRRNVGDVMLELALTP